jgi:chitinase
MRKNSLDYKTILNLYLAMPKHNRSVRGLHTQLLHKYEQMINSKTISIPHLNTLWNWSSKNNWTKLAEQHDLKVTHKFNERIVNKQVNELDKMDSIVNDLQETSYLALQKITTALKQDLMKPIENASELKSLVNSVTDAMKMYSLMTGGVSSRSETVSHSMGNKKAIREEIIQLITSLSNDGIDINLEDKEDKKKLN